MVNSLLNRWQDLNPREQWIVGAGGLFAVVLACYFMVIEPLQKHSQRLNQIADKQSQQLVAMQSMAEDLLSAQSQDSAEKLLQPYLVVQQQLPSGGKMSQTGTVPTDKALDWLPQLASQGKVRYVANDNGIKIYFWEQ